MAMRRPTMTDRRFPNNVGWIDPDAPLHQLPAEDRLALAMALSMVPRLPIVEAHTGQRIVVPASDLGE